MVKALIMMTCCIDPKKYIKLLIHYTGDNAEKWFFILIENKEKITKIKEIVFLIGILFWREK